jgi:putative membrane protein insertion efficiency factor
MRGLVSIFIRIYQVTLSPLLVAVTGSGCRFEPTCSEYFLRAVQMHGAMRGTWMGLRRIGRCHPWGGSGNDPVPRHVDLIDVDLA